MGVRFSSTPWRAIARKLPESAGSLKGPAERAPRSPDLGPAPVLIEQAEEKNRPALCGSRLAKLRAGHLCWRACSRIISDLMILLVGSEFDAGMTCQEMHSK